MKKRIIILFFTVSVFAFSASYTGIPFFTDMPGGLPFQEKEFLVSYDFTLGSTNTPLSEIEPHKIYYNGNIRLSFVPKSFVQISLFFYCLDPFTTALNLDFNILKEDGKYQPAIFVGLQNLSWNKFISTEGDELEYDHKTYPEDSVFNANSPYIAFTKTINHFVLNAGLGSGRFVGFSKWSDRVNIGDILSFFGGIGYRLKIGSTEILASVEEDGRDFNGTFNGYFNIDKYRFFVIIGAQKLEHWFQNSGFQPKFYFGFGVGG
jgi:hypothetical protein